MLSFTGQRSSEYAIGASITLRVPVLALVWKIKKTNNSKPTADTISDELMVTFEPLAANEADVSLRSLF